MRQKVLNKILNKIRLNLGYSEEKLLEIKYGLETFYITISKTIVIMLANYLLNNFKELIFLMIFYGLLRLTGFGLHAKKSWHCWALSLSIFIIVPLLIKYLNISIIVRLIIYIICIIYILKYAPSDTEKRPLISRRKRIMYKIFCFITAFGLSTYGLISYNQIIQNSIMFSLIIETIMINPQIYKIFKLRYGNYKYH